ncbi:MAG: metal-sensing transcriptional repressor [Firmicutes bacterium]|nr:metal-sensing transcriptional repressor [Bacillota bacterium]
MTSKNIDIAAEPQTETCCSCCNGSADTDQHSVNCCGSRTKERSEKEYKDFINRLSRIEGQIRGIKGMVEESAYCPDILTQVAAARAALNSFSKVLLASHIKTCVMDDIKAGNDETVDELVDVLQKIMK